MTELPLVSIVIPARNEALSISSCLRAIAAQTYPHDRMEILVVDGASSDATASVARKALERSGYSRWAVLDNPSRSTPAGLNIGLREALGEYVARIDARASVPPEYVTKITSILMTRPDIAVVGGAQVARAAPGAGVVPRAIARSLRNPYATGLSAYRRRRSPGPSDTVYLGAFRRMELLEARGWDERFLTNQDYELNRRLARRGTVWFQPDLQVEYRPRESLDELARQYRRFGRWKAAAWLEAPGSAMAARHVALLLAPLMSLLLWRRLALQRPRLALCAAGAAFAVLDATAAEPAPANERALATVATCVSTSCWLGGIVEQTLRFVMGQRMLQGTPSTDKRGMTTFF